MPGVFLGQDVRLTYGVHRLSHSPDSRRAMRNVGAKSVASGISRIGGGATVETKQGLSPFSPAFTLLGVLTPVLVQCLPPGGFQGDDREHMWW